MARANTAHAKQLSHQKSVPKKQQSNENSHTDIEHVLEANGVDDGMDQFDQLNTESINNMMNSLEFSDEYDEEKNENGSDVDDYGEPGDLVDDDKQYDTDIEDAYGKLSS